jgi:hypothetical protein
MEARGMICTTWIVRLRHKVGLHMLNILFELTTL